MYGHGIYQCLYRSYQDYIYYKWNYIRICINTSNILTTNYVMTSLHNL